MPFISTAPHADPREVSEIGFPATGGALEKLHFVLNCAVLAPSNRNSQPWRFRLCREAVELYADRRRALAVVDPDDRELTASCGSALYYLRIALRYFGYLGATAVFPDPRDSDLLARIGLGDPAEPLSYERSLFHAIGERGTYRAAFERTQVEERVLAELVSAAGDEGAWLHIVETAEQRDRVAALIAHGDQILTSDRHYCREFASWIHPDRAMSRDGMPGYVRGVGCLSFDGDVDHWHRRDRGLAARSWQLAEASPVLAVLGTDTDSPRAWLAAGQALAKVLLHARVNGVSASFLNQPIEVPDLRWKLLDTLGVGGFPQLLLRLGYGSEVPPTPRRPLGEVVW
jgi:nitroreductase